MPILSGCGALPALDNFRKVSLETGQRDLNVLQRDLPGSGSAAGEYGIFFMFFSGAIAALGWSCVKVDISFMFLLLHLFITILLLLSFFDNTKALSLVLVQYKSIF